MSAAASEVLIESIKNGSLVHVDHALAKFSKDVSKANASEVTPLHVAVWRNNVPIIERVLAAGADTEVQDGESGWTPLHRALYFGHLAASARLLKAGASVEALDHRGRTPLDLLAVHHWAPGHAAASGTAAGSMASCAVYSWGSGANYQLGTGSTDFHEAPVRVDSLHQMQVVTLAAAKYHSAALTADGQLYTWGWGRGGRLGHPDFQIHSGETALIQAWHVAGLGRRAVAAVAAGKHHMVAATTAGEVFTWGSNKDGKLGYAAGDTQPTPRKIADFRHRIVLVAASNRHSAAISSVGAIFTWGANNDGQLGYGTHNASNNTAPRGVEAMKGKVLVAVSLAKRHSVVVSTDGEVYTWGQRQVTPRKVQLAGARDTARACGPPGQLEVRFHRGQSEVARPVAVNVAAGYSHTTVLTAAGGLLTWCSADPAFKAVEVLGTLAGKHVVSISAGKIRTAVVTDAGDLYVWDAVTNAVPSDHAAGSQPSDRAQSSSYEPQPRLLSLGAGASSSSSNNIAVAPIIASTPAASAGDGARDTGSRLTESGSALLVIIPQRINGLKKVSSVAVGEKHSLALQQWVTPYMSELFGQPASKAEARSSGIALGENAGRGLLRGGQPGSSRQEHASPPSGSGLDLSSATSSSSVSPSAAPATSAASLSGAATGRRRHGSGDASDGSASDGRQGLSWSALCDAMNSEQHSVVSSMESYSGARGPDHAASNLPGSYVRHDDGWMQSHEDGQQAVLGSSTAAVPSLQVLCQRVVVSSLVEPRNALPILEYADVAGVPLLRSYCLALSLANLDVVLQEARAAWEALPLSLLVEMEAQHKATVLAPGQAGSVASGWASWQCDSRTSTAGTTSLGSSPHMNSLLQAPLEQLLGRSPGAALNSGAAGGSGGAGQWRALLARLQPGLRPTGPPGWMSGAPQPSAEAAVASSYSSGSDPHAHAPAGECHADVAVAFAGTGSAVAFSNFRSAGPRAAALGAVGHAPAPVGTVLHRGTGNNIFQSRAGGEGQISIERMEKSLARKLEQIAGLERQVGAGKALDAQQLAKMSQRGVLTEAWQTLQAGAPLEHVQQLVAHALEVAGKLATSSSGAAAPGAGSGITGMSSATGRQLLQQEQAQAGQHQREAAARTPTPQPSETRDDSSTALPRRKGKAKLDAQQVPGGPQVDGLQAALRHAGPSEALSAAGAGAGAVEREGTARQQLPARDSGPQVSSPVKPFGTGKHASAGDVTLASDVLPSTSITAASAIQPAVDPGWKVKSSGKERKGGLNLFLSGGLDKKPPLSPVPLPQLAAAPSTASTATSATISAGATAAGTVVVEKKVAAWGGAGAAVPAAAALGGSLRDILGLQQSVTAQPVVGGGLAGGSFTGRSPGSAASSLGNSSAASLAFGGSMFPGAVPFSLGSIAAAAGGSPSLSAVPAPASAALLSAGHIVGKVSLAEFMAAKKVLPATAKRPSTLSTTPPPAPAPPAIVPGVHSSTPTPATGAVSLGSSAAIAASPTAPAAKEREAWGMARGSSPPPQAPQRSLKDIQSEQESARMRWGMPSAVEKQRPQPSSAAISASVPAAAASANASGAPGRGAASSSYGAPASAVLESSNGMSRAPAGGGGGGGVSPANARASAGAVWGYGGSSSGAGAPSNSLMISSSPHGNSMMYGSSPTGGRAVLGVSPSQNKWYVPEPVRPMPLSAIQSEEAEEALVRQLMRQYGADAGPNMEASADAPSMSSAPATSGGDKHIGDRRARRRRGGGGVVEESGGGGRGREDGRRSRYRGQQQGAGDEGAGRGRGGNGVGISDSTDASAYTTAAQGGVQAAGGSDQHVEGGVPNQAAGKARGRGRGRCSGGRRAGGGSLAAGAEGGEAGICVGEGHARHISDRGAHGHGRGRGRGSSFATDNSPAAGGAGVLSGRRRRTSDVAQNGHSASGEGGQRRGSHRSEGAESSSMQGPHQRQARSERAEPSPGTEQGKSGSRGDGNFGAPHPLRQAGDAHSGAPAARVMPCVAGAAASGSAMTASLVSATSAPSGAAQSAAPDNTATASTLVTALPAAGSLPVGLAKGSVADELGNS